MAIRQNFSPNELEKARYDGRLGLRSLPGRQTRHRRVHEALLPLPRERDRSRLGFYSL